MRHRSNRRGRQYAAIPNSAMRDQGLSIEARGMLALLMTYSDDWSFQRSHLMQVANVGRDKFQRIMRELIEAGYIDREAVRAEGGQVSGSTWVIKDAPDRQPENPVVGSTEGLNNRQPEKPTAGFSGPIRRPTEKKTNIEECVCPEHEAAFDQYWSIHPRPRNRARTRSLFLEAMSNGIDPHRVLKAAEAYCKENEGNRSMYISYSDNWLEQSRWKDIAEEKPTPNSGVGIEATAAMFAERIKAGQYVTASGISHELAQIMQAKFGVTTDQLRRSGVQL